MDEELDRRLREIEDLAGMAASEAGGGLDVLEMRNELEDVENRLAEFIRETGEGLAVRIEANTEAIQRLHQRLDEIASMVEVVQAELPAD
jgi:archaellum component FlaC